MQSRWKGSSNSSTSTRSNCWKPATKKASKGCSKVSSAAPCRADRPRATPRPGAPGAAPISRNTWNACRNRNRRLTCRSARPCSNSEQGHGPVNSSTPRLNASFFRTAYGWPYLLAPLIPVAVALELIHAPATVVFAVSALGIIPTAALMGRATEELAAKSGPGIGGFLNVTFGNAPELIIALFALGSGLQEVVKASIVGSILGNILLVLGAAMLAGGIKRERQYFDRTAANVTSLMLLLAVTALIMPALFELVQGSGLPKPTEEAHNYDSDVEKLSVGVAIVLLATYVAGLF